MGTHYRGSPTEIRALDAHIKLMRASASVADRIAASLERAGFELSESQVGVLEALFHLGPLGHCDLGSKLFTSRPNVTLLVDRLEARGLVRRERSAKDRRAVVVHLTPKGRALMEKRFPEHVAGIVAAYAALAPDEQVELARLCRKLGLGTS